MPEIKIIIGLLFLTAAAGILYYLWKKTADSAFPAGLPPAKFPWYSPLFSNPFAQKRIQRQAAERKHKVHHQQQEEFLLEHGLEPKKMILPQELEKLHQLVSQHQQSKLWRQLTSGERNAFERLEELVTGIKKKPQLHHQKLPQKRATLTSRQHQDIFSLLRKISGQK